VDVRVRIAHLSTQLAWLRIGSAEAAPTGRLRSAKVDGASRLTRASVDLTDAILSGNGDALEEASRQEEHSVRIRAGLHLAGIALGDGHEDEAARLLRIVLSSQPTPGQLQFEAPFLKDLYSWARKTGWPLPAELPTPSRKVEVPLYGGLRMSVAERPVHLELTQEAAAVASRLCDVHEETVDQLCRYVLGRSGTGGRAALARALRRLRLVFGTQDCVRVDDEVVRLDRRWEWRAKKGSGPVAFAGLDSDYARDVELNRSTGRRQRTDSDG